MENEVFAGWSFGTSLIAAGGLVALWYVGRPLLKLLKLIGGFFARIGGAIRRFLQPIYEFLYRSFYVLVHIAFVAGFGFVAVMPFVTGDRMEMINHIEAGAAALIIAGLTVIVFRHFRKFPLRKGLAHQVAQAAGDLDTDSLEDDLDFDVDI